MRLLWEVVTSIVVVAVKGILMGLRDYLKTKGALGSEGSDPAGTAR